LFATLHEVSVQAFPSTKAPRPYGGCVLFNNYPDIFSSLLRSMAVAGPILYTRADHVFPFFFPLLRLEHRTPPSPLLFCNRFKPLSFCPFPRAIIDFLVPPEYYPDLLVQLCPPRPNGPEISSILSLPLLTTLDFLPVPLSDFSDLFFRALTTQGGPSPLFFFEMTIFFCL